MGEAADHIASWEAAGLIDPELAATLRAAVLADADRTTEARSGATPAALFGPSVHVTEAFAYLGVIFLLAAWTTFITQQAPLTTQPALVAALGVGAAGVAFALFGGYLRRGDARRRRGAGWAWLVATVYLGAMAFLFGSWLFRPDEEAVLVVGAMIAVAAAVAFRVWLPSVLTQVGLLASLTTLAAALLLWARAIVFPDTSDGSPVTGGSDAVLMVVLEAGWWLAWAVALGVIGLREAASGNPAADRRASVTRLWAGFTAVLGVASAVTRSSIGPNDEFGRVIEPWLGDLVIAIISAVLIERAFRRGSGAFLVAGAFGLIIALSDFNASYLTDTVATGLLVEGVILLAIGFGAGRLRGRLRRPGAGQAPDRISPVMRGTGSDPPTTDDDAGPDTRITGG